MNPRRAVKGQDPTDSRCRFVLCVALFSTSIKPIFGNCYVSHVDFISHKVILDYYSKIRNREVEESTRTHRLVTTFSHCLIAMKRASHCLVQMKRAILLRKPTSLLMPQQSRTDGPSGQDVEVFRLIWEYSLYWQPPVGPAPPGGQCMRWW